MPTTITKTIKATGGDYSSLAAFEAALPADLTAVDQIWQAECYSFQDTSPVTFSGTVTDATRYIRVYAAAGQRHNGIADNGYRLQSNFTQHAMTIAVDHIRIEGIAFTWGVDLGSLDAIRITSNANTRDIRISECAINAFNHFLYCDPGSSGVVKFWNNVAYGNGNASWGVRAVSGTMYAYNNTLVATGGNWGFGALFRRDGGTVVAKNNLVANSGGTNVNCYSGTFDAASAYNLSSDSTAPGSNAQTSVTVAFYNAASSNFHLDSGDTAAKNHGTDLSADANLALTTDIDASTRTGTWDIGADEVISVTRELDPPVISSTNVIYDPSVFPTGTLPPPVIGSTAAVISPTLTQIRPGIFPFNLIVGEWGRVPRGTNTWLIDVAPSPSPGGAEGADAVIDDWNGAAVDTSRSDVLIMGGGHAGYAGNEVYAFSFDPDSVNFLKWRRKSLCSTADPLPPSGAEHNPDGTPTSRHTYASTLYLPTQDEYFLGPGGFVWGGAAFVSAQCYTFDATTETPNATAPTAWVQRDASPIIAPLTTAQAYPLLAYHSGDDRVYGKMQAGFVRFNRTASASSQWTTFTTWESATPPGGGFNTSVLIDPTRNLFITVGGGAITARSCASPYAFIGSESSFGETGATVVRSASAPGAVYDPNSDRVVMWAGLLTGGTDRRDLYYLDLDTKVITRVACTGDVPTAPNTNYTFSRFAYLGDGLCFLVNDARDDVYFVRVAETILPGFDALVSGGITMGGAADTEYTPTPGFHYASSGGLTTGGAATTSGFTSATQVLVVAPNWPLVHQLTIDNYVASFGDGFEQRANFNQTLSRADGQGGVTGYKGVNTFIVKLKAKDFADEAAALWQFYKERNGSLQAFYIYNVPDERASADPTGASSTGRYLVRFAQPALTREKFTALLYNATLTLIGVRS